MADSHTALSPFDAVLFDLDGVLTSTAAIHAACWKSMFDDFLTKRAASRQQPLSSFDIESDYKRYVDGKPRYEGVRSFLESRGIEVVHNLRCNTGRSTYDFLRYTKECESAKVDELCLPGFVQPDISPPTYQSLPMIGDRQDQADWIS